MTVCYFTASGNCLYVAKRIGGELLSIPQLMRQDEIEIADEAVGIVCPVYACEMPMMVREFLKRAKISAGYLFFIYTYGSGYAEAFAHAELAARESGLTINYLNAVRMVDNYLPMFDMQKQLDSLADKHVEEQLDTVAREISERVQRPARIGLGTQAKMAVVKRRLADKILLKDTAQGYIVTDACVLCGICAKVCPADNIIVTDKVSFSDRCEVCYACLHNCPQGAIRLRREAGTARFRNEHVSLQEIVQANG